MSSSHRIAEILRLEKVCAEIVREDSMLSAFRSWLKMRMMVLAMKDKSKRWVLWAIALDTRLVDGQFEATGNSTQWGKDAGMNRKTVSNTIWDLQADGWFMVLQFSDGGKGWSLRWDIDTEVYRRLEGRALVARRDKISNTIDNMQTLQNINSEKST